MTAPLVQLVYKADDIPAGHHTSGGTVADIVVGAVVGLVLVLALVWSLLRWRRQRIRQRDKHNSAESSWPKAELPGQGKPLNEADEAAEVRELEAAGMRALVAHGVYIWTVLVRKLAVPNSVHEVHDNTTTIHELEAPDVVHELHDSVLAEVLPGKGPAEPEQGHRNSWSEGDEIMYTRPAIYNGSVAMKRSQKRERR
ncbi:MAG: hypothetical protein M1821_004258 [Bathelium mastoideum]|nr:MAG: hypothetical protein M1821_004258 [Bathelium mastoideum]